MSDELSTEQIEIRVWAVVVLTLAAILAVSVFTILMSVMFVDQDMERVAPVDEAFLGIIKDVMMLCIGAIGGLVGRNSVNAAAKLMSKEEPK
jgi:hypothetical protein